MIGRKKMNSNSIGNDFTAFGNSGKELCFEWRPAHRQYKRTVFQRQLIWVICALLLVMAVLAFWQLWKLWLLFNATPGFIDQLKTLGWHSLKKRQIFQLTVALPLYLVVIVAVVWVQRRLRCSRLYLNSTQLRHSSGLPLWLGNLLKQNWTLSLDDFRTGQMRFTLAGMARSNAPLAWFFLRWNVAAHKTRRFKGQITRQQLAPTGWFLIGEPARDAIQAPKGLFWRSLIPWTTPAGKAVLQKAFDGLSLVVALRAQGLDIPPISAARRPVAGAGFDLMAYPRMKAVVLSFFGLMAGAAVAYHLMRHQHFFEAPAVWAWVVFGAVCALSSWLWLRVEQAPTVPSFKTTQGLCAALFGVAAALLAPSALLAVNLVLSSPQSIAVTVVKAPLQLLPDDKTIPPFSPSQAKEFWAAQYDQPARQIAVREGILGLWQYDSEPLQAEVLLFYDKYGR